jgi:hypothetical protein
VTFEKLLSFVSSVCKLLSSTVSSGWLSFKSCVSSVRSCVCSVSKGGGYMHVRSCVCSVSMHTHRTRDKLCLQCQPLLQLTTTLLSFNSLTLCVRLSFNAQTHTHTFVPGSHSTHKHTQKLLCQPLIQVPVYIYSSKKGLIMVIVCMCVYMYLDTYTRMYARMYARLHLQL